MSHEKVTMVNDETGGLLGMGAVLDEVSVIRSHGSTYVIFDLEKIDPVKIRVVGKGGLDTSGNVRETPPQELLMKTFGECRALINKDASYFVVYDFGYYNDRNNYRDMIMLISYIPDTLSFRHKIAFASNIATIMSRLSISQHIETHEIEEFTYEAISQECSRVQRK